MLDINNELKIINVYNQMLWKLVIIDVNTGNSNWEQLIANNYVYLSCCFVMPLSTWRNWCVAYRPETNFLLKSAKMKYDVTI